MDWVVKDKYKSVVEQAFEGPQQQNQDLQQEQAKRHMEQKKDDVFAEVRQNLNKTKVSQKSFEAISNDEIGFSSTFGRTGGFKSDGPTDEQQASIERKKVNSETIKKSKTDYDAHVNDLFSHAKKMFSNSKKLTVTESMKAIAQFMTDNANQNANRLLAIAKAEDLSDILNDAISQYMELDFSQIDLQTDQSFADNSARIYEIAKKTEALQTLLQSYPAYFTLNDQKALLNEDQFNALQEKLKYGQRISFFYKAKSDLINDKYYQSHANSELSVVSDVRKQLTAESSSREKKQREFQRKYWMCSLYKNGLSLEHGMDFDQFLDRFEGHKDTTNAALEYMLGAGQELMNREFKTETDKAEAHSVHREIYKNERSFLSFRRIFASIGIRYVKKRTADHGRCNFDASVEKMNLIPERFKNGEEFTVQKGTAGFAPEIPVSSILKSRKKTEMAQLVSTFKQNHQGSNYLNDDTVKKLLTAMDSYSKLQILSNKDTFEMEMAFVDTFQYELKQLKDSRGANADQELSRIISDFTLMQDKLSEGASGTMVNDLNEIIVEQQRVVDGIKNGPAKKNKAIALKYAEDKLKIYTDALENYNKQVKYSPAIYDDHNIKDNMRESNVKDIPLFTHEPCVGDITQGAMGDCWLLGALGAIVKASPKSIENMFQDLGNGDVMVRLYIPYDADGHRLNNPLDDNKLSYRPEFFKLRKHYETGSNGATGCLWPQLVEKAIAAANITIEDHKAQLGMQDGKMTYMSTQLTSGDPEVVLPLITGWQSGVLSKSHKNTEEFILGQCRTAFTEQNGKKGSVTFMSGTHCITALDMKEENGQTFLLIKDPFNIYQYKYTKNQKGKVSEDDDGLWTALWKNNSLNHVSEHVERNETKAYAGLSWWRIQDVFQGSSSDWQTIVYTPDIFKENKVQQ